MTILLYDDYNQKVIVGEDCIGTITTQIGNKALRHGWKLIEIYADDDTDMRRL